MTTDTQNIQLSSNPTDRDYLEMLLYKLAVMKFHGANYYARKQDTDKRLFDKARADVNEYMKMLNKRGYSGERFNIKKPTQGKLI
jgi:hypothetical protein